MAGVPSAASQVLDLPEILISIFEQVHSQGIPSLLSAMRVKRSWSTAARTVLYKSMTNDPLRSTHPITCIQGQRARPSIFDSRGRRLRIKFLDFVHGAASINNVNDHARLIREISIREPYPSLDQWMEGPIVLNGRPDRTKEDFQQALRSMDFGNVRKAYLGAWTYFGVDEDEADAEDVSFPSWISPNLTHLDMNLYRRKQLYPLLASMLPNLQVLKVTINKNHEGVYTLPLMIQGLENLREFHLVQSQLSPMEIFPETQREELLMAIAYHKNLRHFHGVPLQYSSITNLIENNEENEILFPAATHVGFTNVFTEGNLYSIDRKRDFARALRKCLSLIPNLYHVGVDRWSQQVSETIVNIKRIRSLSVERSHPFPSQKRWWHPPDRELWRSDIPAPEETLNQLKVMNLESLHLGAYERIAPAQSFGAITVSTEVIKSFIAAQSQLQQLSFGRNELENFRPAYWSDDEYSINREHGLNSRQLTWRRSHGRWEVEGFHEASRLYKAAVGARQGLWEHEYMGPPAEATLPTDGLWFFWHNPLGQ